MAGIRVERATYVRCAHIIISGIPDFKPPSFLPITISLIQTKNELAWIVILSASSLFPEKNLAVTTLMLLTPVSPPYTDDTPIQRLALQEW